MIDVTTNWEYTHPRNRSKTKLLFSETIAVDFGFVGEDVAMKALDKWRDSAKRIMASAKAKCPVSPPQDARGKHTRDTIRASARFIKKSLRIVGWVKTNSAHGLWPEIGTIHTPAQPFLRPAREAEMPALMRSLENLV